MKSGAIFQSATELIDLIQSTEKPANDIINAYTRARRYIGSKDRRALTDLVWGYIRHRRRLMFLAPAGDTAERLRLLQTGAAESVPEASFAVNMEVPDWILPFIPDVESELPALLDSAPTVLRVNGNRDKIRAELKQAGIDTDPTPLSPYGLILKGRANLQTLSCYREGRLEVQDEGSQLIALETGIRPGDKVLDYCAGAGGKSLIFAQMMQDRGIIVAHDSIRSRLSELHRRANRAHLKCIQIPDSIPDIGFDHVVADVPCSGTGTWRRTPDMRWKLTPERLAELTRIQSDIFDSAVRFVRPGGFISYMTCSLLRPEDEAQVDSFLKRHPTLRLIRAKRFSPALTKTDGFFVAIFQSGSES